MQAVWKSVGLFSLTFLLVGFILYPISSMVIGSLWVEGSLSFSRYADFFSLESTSNLEALWNSVWVSLLTAFVSGILGTGLAIVLSEFGLPGRRLLARVAVLPVALPPLVGVLAFYFLVGEGGILPRLVETLVGVRGGHLGIAGFSGVILVHTYVFYVYFYLFVSAALSRMDASLIEAAESLGSTRWHTLRKVVIPQLKPALVGSTLLTFMMSMASFTAPLIFAADKRFLTLQIYNAKLNGDFGLAATQSVVLTAMAVGFLMFLRKAWGDLVFLGAAKGVPRPLRVKEISSGRVWQWSLSLFLGALLLLPILTILLISVAQEGSWASQVLPEKFTISNYADLFARTDVFEPIVNSLFMSTLATGAAVVLGLGIGYVSVRGGWRWGAKALEATALLPFAIPGTVLAINFILAFNTPTVFTAYQILVGTFWILPLAYVVRNLPLVVRSAIAGLQQADPSLEEAASNLGAGSVRRLRRILLPVILPSVVSGALLTFIACMGEFVMSIMLYTVVNRPISVEVFSQLRLFNFGGAAAYSVILLFLIVVAVEISERVVGGSRVQVVQF